MLNFMREPEFEIRHERLTRHLHLPWPPGFFMPGCLCCGATASQAYHVFGGEKGGTPNVIVSTNFQWNAAWSTKAAMSVTREQMGRATPSITSAAYLYGGDSSTSPFFLSRTDNYTPDSWATDTAMPTPARFAQASVAISTLCYSWGGKNSGGSVQSQNDQMTPGSPSTWATKTAVTVALAFAAATYIGAKGYNFCGAGSTGASVQTNYEYDPSGNSWTTKTSSPSSARNGAAAFTIAGTAYLIDGGAAITRRNDSYVVNTWTTKTQPLSPDRQYPGGASLDSSGVGWLTGGLLQSGSYISTHDEYVPDSWTNRTASTTTLCYTAATPA